MLAHRAADSACDRAAVAAGELQDAFHEVARRHALPQVLGLLTHAPPHRADFFFHGVHAWRPFDHISVSIRSVVFRLPRSEEHTSELQSLMRISYAVFCLKKKKIT